MIKISIVSDIEITNFLIEDIFGTKKECQNNNILDIKEGWYLLKVPFIKFNNQIRDIQINDESIKHLLYTGYFKNQQNKIIQPQTALIEEGNFEIWLHTNIGFYFKTVMGQIQNGDFGTNLFEKYKLTVDKPVEIAGEYPESVKNFFNSSVGPVWWKKNSIQFPFEIIDSQELQQLDKKLIVEELKKICNFLHTPSSVWTQRTLKEKTDLPSVEIDTINSNLIQQLLKIIGYKSIIDICLMNLKAHNSIHLHRDDMSKRKMYEIAKGCKKFYWNLDPCENVYFKLGDAGLLPLETPLFINTNEHVHSVVNNRDSDRYVLIIHGIF
jgi:hypothetical protein